ncbi:V-set and immunoglobulin domain-containing protein 10-like isoform X2 [Denticeps clupeoides]|uniref:V-set and immunoglobulin domain-containing protein 10-like isoform X2 n=1 Tax=Denticeps clupeoides TaxID=299321 RepID=UPI0010A477E0|nr:V-set and immunoglobulin domain-containing protein 10-like isoform X2 [Denticeps clupeoides]
MPLHRRSELQQTCLGLIFISMIRGRSCKPNVMPTGLSVVNALVGTNLTMGIIYTDATDPQVSWWIDVLPVATWTVGSVGQPSVAAQHRGVLFLEPNGSLTFRGVTLNYSGSYTVKVVQSGVGQGTATFTLTVYEIIKDVSLHMWPKYAIEGSTYLDFYYTTTQGAAKETKWFFNGVEIINGSHNSINGKNLTVKHLKRSDTGQYSVSLRNPYSSGTAYINVKILYGPGQPVLQLNPKKDFFVFGESLSLMCGAQGEPLPSVSWIFGGHVLSRSQSGMLNLTAVQTNQSGVYTCLLENGQTGLQLMENITLKIYENPKGSPACSVLAVNGSSALQYHCQWPGGSPLAELSFPTLNQSCHGSGNFVLTVSNTQGLNGKPISCLAKHPLQQKKCDVIASEPSHFSPSVSTVVSPNGNLVVSITCYAKATPVAMVTWSISGHIAIIYHLSEDSTHLSILNFNLSTVGVTAYTCNATNPLGVQSKNFTLLGPAVSNASFVINSEGTVVILTWDMPSTATITAFEVQMKGPDLTKTRSQNGRAADKYRTIQVEPASSRSANISGFHPKLVYYIRIVPMVGNTAGLVSKELKIGPETMSGAAIVGIAAGIPCTLLVLLSIVGLIVLCIRSYRKKNREPCYPVCKAIEKVATTVPVAPHQLLHGEMKPPPDYSIHQRPTQRPGQRPSDASPVRMATTV